MKTTVLLALSAAVAFGQFPPNLGGGGGGNCEQGFKCMAQKIGAGGKGPSPAQRAQMKEMIMAAKEAAGQTITGCFVDAGCEDPVPKMEAFGECMKTKLGGEAMQPIVKCMRAQGVRIPEDAFQKLQAIKNGEAPEGGPPSGLVQLLAKKLKMGGKPPKPEKLKKKLQQLLRKVADEVCDNGQQKRAAMQCARDAAEEAMANLPQLPAGAGGKGKGGKPDRAKMFALARECGVGIPCLMQIKQAKDAACTCSARLNTPEAKRAIEGAVMECKEAADIDSSLTEKEKDMIQKKLRKIKNKVCKGPGGGNGNRGRGRGGPFGGGPPPFLRG